MTSAIVSLSYARKSSVFFLGNVAKADCSKSDKQKQNDSTITRREDESEEDERGEDKEYWEISNREMRVYRRDGQQLEM